MTFKRMNAYEPISGGAIRKTEAPIGTDDEGRSAVTIDRIYDSCEIGGWLWDKR